MKRNRLSQRRRSSRAVRAAALILIAASCASTAQEYVVLLHGLARSSGSMDKMADALKQQGYLVVNHDYPSTDATVQQLSAQQLSEALSACPQGVKVHFVTHSMGGILLRQYLKDNRIPNIGRAVMLGPPNRGSEVVDNLRDVPGFQLINGPAGMELGTGADSLPASLGATDLELGVIAGSRSINLLLSSMLPNPDDGKVSVENTKVEGMDDHIVLPATHPFLMKNSRAIYQVLHFLQHGRFDHWVNR